MATIDRDTAAEADVVEQGIGQEQRGQSGDPYKLVGSKSGNNLYVEAKEYDPLEHHRPRDQAANKGQGLGFMFCCFSSKTKDVDEVERYGYEVKPEENNKAE